MSEVNQKVPLMCTFVYIIYTHTHKIMSFYLYCKKKKKKTTHGPISNHTEKLAQNG